MLQPAATRPTDPRAALRRRAEERGVSLSDLSVKIGRNVAYVQQYLERGTPRRLPEDERRHLAIVLEIDEREADVIRRIFSEYVRAYHIEHARLAGETSREASRLDRRIGDAKRKLDRLVAIITDGGGEFSELREALSKAKREHAELVTQRDAIEAMPVIALHPGIADDYRRQVEQLQSALHDHEAAKLEAIPKLRALIDRVVLTPVAGELQIEVIGRIAEMIGLATPATRTLRRAVR